MAKRPTSKTDFPFDLILANDEDNARQTVEGIEELAADILANGLLQRLGIRIEESPELTEDERMLLGLEEGDDAPEMIGRLTYGFRRYYAIQHIRSENPDSFEKVPWEEIHGNCLDGVYANLAENIARKDLTPGELAERFHHLRYKLKQTTPQIAAKVPTLSKGYIQNLISLRKKLTTGPWEAFRDGGLTFDVAKSIASQKGEKAQAKLLKTAKTVSAGQDGRKKKTGVKKAVKDAVDVAKGKNPRPGTRDVKKELARYEDPQNNYDKGVQMALLWVTGGRRNIPRPKGSPKLKSPPKKKAKSKKKGSKRASAKATTKKTPKAKPAVKGKKKAGTSKSKPARA